MTTNKPTTYWAPSTALHKLASRHNSAPCILTDGPAEFNDVALVRLADYEALQAAHEEELFQVRQDRDTHFGELMRALEQVDALQAECEKLRKDAERYRWLCEPKEWPDEVDAAIDCGSKVLIDTAIDTAMQETKT